MSTSRKSFRRVIVCIIREDAGAGGKRLYLAPEPQSGLLIWLTEPGANRSLRFALPPGTAFAVSDLTGAPRSAIEKRA
jgi:hypothetical protein